MRGSSGTDRRVLLAMSGGVDSSVAASLLLERGHEVIGVFMRLGSPGDVLDEPLADDLACDPRRVRVGHRGCCSVNDAADAREVAARLGIPFYVVNFRKEFGRIVDYFVDAYARGRTPNPCVRCNDWLKFGRLHEYAARLGAGAVASGHYARVERRGERFALLRGVDAGKDQSYVLFGVPRARLGSVLLPVGGYTKAEIREFARRRGLPVFDKPDSQEICFVPDDDYAGLIERRRPDLASEGAIVDASGAVVGRHGGQHRFTLGQRRGVGVALGHPIYVVGKDAGTNTVTVGERRLLLRPSLLADEANWLVPGLSPGATRRVLVQTRSSGGATPGVLSVLEDGQPGKAGPSGRCGRFRVDLDEPSAGVVPGQAAVCYDADEPEVVLGGGWITPEDDGEAA